MQTPRAQLTDRSEQTIQTITLTLEKKKKQ